MPAVSMIDFEQFEGAADAAPVFLRLLCHVLPLHSAASAGKVHVVRAAFMLAFLAVVTAHVLRLTPLTDSEGAKHTIRGTFASMIFTNESLTVRAPNHLSQSLAYHIRL